MATLVVSAKSSMSSTVSDGVAVAFGFLVSEAEASSERERLELDDEAALAWAFF